MPVPKVGDKRVLFARRQKILFMHPVASVKTGSSAAVFAARFCGGKDVKMRPPYVTKKHASGLARSLGKLAMLRQKNKNGGFY